MKQAAREGSRRQRNERGERGGDRGADPGGNVQVGTTGVEQAEGGCAASPSITVVDGGTGLDVHAIAGAQVTIN